MLTDTLSFNVWFIISIAWRINVNISPSFKSVAFDIHSGLREVKWAFGVYENNTVLIEKAVAVTATAKTVSIF
jgi:hypothetical protein